MIRILLSFLLITVVVAETWAQGAPAGTAVQAAASSKTAARRPTKKAGHHTVIRKTMVKKAGTNSAATKPIARPHIGTSGRTDIGPGGNGAVGSTESADGKGQGVYAAPGMPVNVSDPKNVSTYDNKPAGGANRTSTSTTTAPPR